MTTPVQQDASGRYLPVLHPEELPYWEAAKRHELVLPRCDSCGTFVLPPKPYCFECLGQAVVHVGAVRIEQDI